MQNKTIIFGILALAAQGLQAVIPSLHTYEKDGKLITFMGSVHSDYADKEKTNEQREHILKAAQAERAAVICEDVWSYNGKDARVVAHVKKINADGGIAWGSNKKIALKNSPKGIQDDLCVDPANGLFARCQSLKIPAYNAECRFYKDASAVGFSITGKEVWLSLHAGIEGILDAHASDDLTPELAWKINTLLHNNQELIQALRALDKNSLQDVIPYMDRHKQLMLANLGIELVDCSILHGFSMLKIAPHLFICAGSIHTRNTQAYVEKIGYRLIKSQDNPIEYDKNITTLDPVDIDAYFEQLHKERMAASATEQKAAPAKKE